MIDTLHISKALIINNSLKVLPILFQVCGIHHQEILILIKAIEVCIVYRASLFIGNYGVLSHTGNKRSSIVGEHMLQEGKGVLSLNDEPPHVGYIEKTGAFPG